MMNDNELLVLLKEFIQESKEASLANEKEHKEINKCLNAIKLKVGAVESLCENSANIRQSCFKKQDDFEVRLREVELLKPLKTLPKQFNALAFKVYAVMALATFINIAASYFLK